MVRVHSRLPVPTPRGCPRAILTDPIPSGPVLVDALNLAFWCGSPPQLRVPLALERALKARKVAVHLCFDASTRYRLPEPENLLYPGLLAANPDWREVPSGTSADEFLLEWARDSGGCIVSRDHFREHRRRFRRVIHGPGRVLSGHVLEGSLHIPGLGILEPLMPASA